MKCQSAIPILAVAAMLVSGCQSEEPLVSAYVRPVPANLPIHGSPTLDSVQVIVYEEVSNPGIYFLPDGATVKDAIVAAGGPTEFTNWSFSCIVSPDGKCTRFSYHNRNADERIRLQHGDRFYLSRQLH